MLKIYYVLIVGTAMMVGYEIIAAVKNQPNDDPLTITQLVKRAADKSKAVPFFFGLLMGHFFL